MNICIKMFLAIVFVAAQGCGLKHEIEISQSNSDKFISLTNHSGKDLRYRSILAIHRGAISDIFDEYNERVFVGFVLTAVDQSGNRYLTCGTIYPTSEYGVYKELRLKNQESIRLIPIPSADQYLACNKNIETLSWQVLYVKSKITNANDLSRISNYEIMFKSNLIPFEFDKKDIAVEYSNEFGGSMIKP